MRKNIYCLLLLVGLGLISCNQSNTPPKATPTSEDTTTAAPETKRINANPGDTVNAKPGDKIYMESTISGQKTHDLPSSFFNQKWMRSQSEDEKYEGEVYRPEGFEDLILMRFTPTFSFNEDNSCEYLIQMPNDAHKMESASWAYNINKQLRIFKKDKSARAMLYDWKVKEIKDDILVVEKIGSGSR